MMVDDNNTQGWEVDCNKEGQEQAVKDSGDSRMVMMAVMADDGSGGRQK